MKRKIVILHNQVLTNKPDELDVIHQRDLVKRACEELNYLVICRIAGRELLDDIESLKSEQPAVVFNLVEEAWGRGEFIYFVPALLNALKIPYTGVPLDALFVTTNKVLAKKMMKLNNIPTADFYSMGELDQLDPHKTYIVKPIWEEASVGISSDSIFKTSEKEKFEQIGLLSSSHYFVEEFIDGREFNISMLTRGDGDVEVLPHAEMIFSDFFTDIPKIVGYQAKWDEKSPEYSGTKREFGTLINKSELEQKLNEICKLSWRVFNLKGYARVDFRVDSNEQVYVLEINGNPCISPDSGFVAAAKYAGYSITTMIDRILQDIN